MWAYVGRNGAKELWLFDDARKARRWCGSSGRKGKYVGRSPK